MLSKELLEKVKVYVDDGCNTKVVLFAGDVVTDVRYGNDRLFIETFNDSRTYKYDSISDIKYLSEANFVFCTIDSAEDILI